MPLASWKHFRPQQPPRFLGLPRQESYKRKGKGCKRRQTLESTSATQSGSSLATGTFAHELAVLEPVWFPPALGPPFQLSYLVDSDRQAKALFRPAPEPHSVTNPSTEVPEEAPLEVVQREEKGAAPLP